MGHTVMFSTTFPQVLTEALFKRPNKFSTFSCVLIFSSAKSHKCHC